MTTDILNFGITKTLPASPRMQLVKDAELASPFGVQPGLYRDMQQGDDAS